MLFILLAVIVSYFSRVLVINEEKRSAFRFASGHVSEKRDFHKKGGQL